MGDNTQLTWGEFKCRVEKQIEVQLDALNLTDAQLDALSVDDAEIEGVHLFHPQIRDVRTMAYMDDNDKLHVYID